MDSIDKEIVKRFTLIRKALNVTQESFANKLNIKRINLADIERGKIGPSRSLMYELTKQFQVSLNWLITGEGSMFKDGKQLDIQKEIMKDSKIKELNQYLDKCHQEIEELKKSVADLEKDNKELSKELIDRLRSLIELEDKYKKINAGLQT